MTVLEHLRQFSIFEQVPDEQLQWLVDRATEETFADGTPIFQAGDALDHLHLMLDGRVRIDGGQHGTAEEIAVFEAHEVLGVLPYSRLKVATGYGYAQGEVRWLALHRDQLRPMAHECYELTEALVHQMTTRVRDFTRQAQQNEKLASLGRLSAGLAHELNNPVAAVVRSADTLKDHLRATPESFKTVMALDLTPAQVDPVNELLFGKIDRPVAPLSLLDRSSREDDITDWLDDRGISDALDLAGPLVDFGFTVDELDWILAQVGDDNLPGVLAWQVGNLVTQRLVREIAEASTRIATLVGSIKNYTHMDRGTGKSDLHLADGIRNTLTLLDHKLKAKKIKVSLHLPDDLPTLCGWPGELNQVWTNLIDNAVDALPDGGRLTLTAEVDNRSDGSAFVLTRVVDNGPGIPTDIRDKIFDPFFTTKAIGKGTGLGLDIVQGIVRHHNGSIKVQSEPGQTEFIVCLPV